MLTFFAIEPHQDLPEDWDDFVINTPSGSIHQIKSWRDFQNSIQGRGPVMAFGVRKKEKLVAACLVVRMQTGFLGKFWDYSPRGPVFEDKIAGQLLIEKSQAILASRGGVFWRMDPYAKDLAYLQNIKNKLSTQDYQPTNTLKLDLTKDDPTLLSEMKRKGRYNINLARKKGIQIQTLKPHEYDDKDLEAFWDLHEATTSRDGFSGHEKTYYQNFLSCLSGHAVLFLATFEGRVLAASISTFCGSKAIYYFGASTSDTEDRRLMAPYLLQWAMIQYARSQNCTTYDFLGIAPENEPHHQYAGISEFKHKFGGYREVYAEGREIVLNEFWYTLYKIAKTLRKARRRASVYHS